MSKITNVSELKGSIRLLELKQAKELSMLKIQFLDTYESLKPLNVIKNSFREFASSPDFKGNLIGTALGLAAGFLSKGVIAGPAAHPIKKIIGTMVQLGISNVVARNSDFLKNIPAILSNFLTKKKVLH